ncbi:hypothetical protein J2M53_09680 [Arthrobacter sp. zg-ZUI100]|uniref:DUF6297 family protein n=1 Tax=Arthrobacter jiangjiafuii TaxID=2817475 RepID=UPI001AED5299|nr:DUF6297 family protein [Arthrobacter jiangjiafuii]MBP3036519.1 hypothetical protein [Arthrobacter jiangjiafuii]
MAQNAAVGDVSTAFNPVGYTRHAAKALRGRTRLRDVLVDVYSAVLTVGTIGAMAAGLVLALREQVAQAWDADPGARTLVAAPSFALPDGAAATALLFAALAAIMVLARKLGPAAATTAEGYWWLTLPVARRPLLTGRLRRRLALVWAGASVLYLPVGFITDLHASGPGQFLGAAVFGVAAVNAVLLSALRQAGAGPVGSGPAGSGRPRSELVGRIATGPLPGLLLLAVLSFVPRQAAAGLWGPALVALASAVALGVVVFPRLETIPAQDLIRAGGVSGHAGAALYLMDANEVGRALSGDSGAVVSTRAARWYARGTRTPFGALLRADTAAFLRTRGWLGRPVMLLMLCALMLVTGGNQPVPLQLALVVVTVFAAVPAAGALARRTAITPGLDVLLPVSASLVRLSRMTLPATLMAVWAAVFLAVLVLLGAGSPELIALGALAGVGFGASAVRGAYRPDPDWTAPPTETVFGPVPSAQTGAMIRGLDTTLLALVPLLLGLFLGYAPGVLLLAQAGFSLACLLVVMFSDPK